MGLPNNILSLHALQFVILILRALNWPRLLLRLRCLCSKTFRRSWDNHNRAKYCNKDRNELEPRVRRSGLHDLASKWISLTTCTLLVDPWAATRRGFLMRGSWNHRRQLARKEAWTRGTLPASRRASTQLQTMGEPRHAKAQRIITDYMVRDRSGAGQSLVPQRY